MIVAIDDKLGISKKGSIPWDLPSDRRYFRNKIVNGPVLMGSRTFQENKNKPYGDGCNFVLSSRLESSGPRVVVVKDLNKFISDFEDDLWVIGGGSVYEQCLKYATRILITRVEGDFECDVRFPSFESQFKLESSSEVFEENETKYCYEIWTRKLTRL